MNILIITAFIVIYFTENVYVNYKKFAPLKNSSQKLIDQNLLSKYKYIKYRFPLRHPRVNYLKKNVEI